jgi:UTP-glucose-1-phosphate uridylyltransferase
VTGITDKATGTFDTGGQASAITPIGRMAFPGDILPEWEDVARGLAPNAELDDVPVLQRLARRNALAGVLNSARFFDVGNADGYRDAVSTFPARA